MAATVGGALVGGFIGNRIGKSMDDEDRRRAAEAQYAAFENGQRADWRSPNGHYGYVEPRPSITYQDMSCREFAQSVISTAGRRRWLAGRAASRTAPGARCKRRETARAPAERATFRCRLMLDRATPLECVRKSVKRFSEKTHES